MLWIVENQNSLGKMNHDDWNRFYRQKYFVCDTILNIPTMKGTL